LWRLPALLEKSRRHIEHSLPSSKRDWCWVD